MDASDGIFFYLCFGFYMRFCKKVEKSSKVGHPNYFSSHFLDEQFGGNAMGKTCTSLA